MTDLEKLKIIKDRFIPLNYIISQRGKVYNILFENIKTFRNLLTEGVGQDSIVDAIQNHEWIYIYDVDRKIGELARDLMWQHESLKPKDATHVATAIQAKVDVLETFDDGLLKLSGTIGDPLLRITRPYLPNQLELFDKI
jgi:predicted nucleic acid-binding protein